jgi:N-methylhydantoinase A
VTDANLLLGRLRSDNFLGGGMPLDVAAARQAVQGVADALGLGLEAAAKGIVALANEHMARALRVMSVQRGLNPAELTLTCFGGAGGLHVCALAEALEMPRALVPVHAGVLSALGMLVAPRQRHLSLTLNQEIRSLSDADLGRHIEELAEAGQGALQEEGVPRYEMQIFPSVDLRYHGQSYAINLPWQGMVETVPAFHQRHQQRYGHRLEESVELVTLRVKVQREGRQISLTRHATGEAKAVPRQVRLVDCEEPVPVYARESLATGQCINGPALITETVSTTYLAPHWHCEVHASGCLILTRT